MRIAIPVYTSPEINTEMRAHYAHSPDRERPSRVDKQYIFRDALFALSMHGVVTR